MKAFTVVAALGFALLTVPAIAQQKPPVQTPPATPPAQQKPATPPAAQPAKPFPEGAKIAICSLQEISGNSKAGQAAAAQMKTLQDRRVKEIDDKRKLIEANQTLLQSPTLAEDKRAALAKEVDRGNTEMQRMQQDAQQELQDLNNELQRTFLGKVNPIIQQIATEKGLQMLFIKEEAGLLWFDPALDLSAEITRRLDAATAAPPKSPVPDSPVPQPPAVRK
jgi:Skp family chaperone for outer membrane proteins